MSLGSRAGKPPKPSRATKAPIPPGTAGRYRWPCLFSRVAQNTELLLGSSAMDRTVLGALLGRFPDGVDANLRMVERTDMGTYVQERVEYDVEHDERVAAFVLVPKHRPKLSVGIVAHHQHAGQWDLGKSEVAGLRGDPEQAYGKELAERGYVVFVPDAVGFEDRNWTPGEPWAGYHALATRLVQGGTLLAKVIHDARVGIDVLCARSDVDSDRIGFIGHSYGGRMALWLPAFEPRIKVSVSNCGCAPYRDLLARDSGVQMEFVVPGIMNAGDLVDVLRLGAPAQILISATTDDKWSRGANELVQGAKPAFPEGNLVLKTWPGSHVFTQEMREAAYAFLDERLTVRA